jgi:hypothetical protein
MIMISCTILYNLSLTISDTNLYTSPSYLSPSYFYLLLPLFSIYSVWLPLTSSFPPKTHFSLHYLTCLLCVSDHSQINHGFEGSAIKGVYCQGFIQLFSSSDPKRFRPKTLTETPSSFLASDYLGPILGSSNW